MFIRQNRLYLYIMAEYGKMLTKAGLQLRMTVFVATAVIFVSLIALLVLSGRIRRDYELVLKESISDNLVAVTRVMEQRLRRVEESAVTIAAVASERVEDRHFVDSLLYHSVEALEDLQGVSMIFRRGWLAGVDGYYERYAYHEDDGRVLLDEYVNGDELDNDADWTSSYLRGERNWGEISENLLSDHNEICFHVPLNDKDGNRVGMLYSDVLVSNLTSFVTEYKLHKDVDISIYKADGTMIVAPDDYILELAPEDMIVKESTIEHIGWKVILSADREIVDSRVRKALLWLFLLMLLTYLATVLAIRFAVKHVARPFIRKQQTIEREKAVMDNEMLLASGAQNDLVPHVFPPFPDRKGIDISACLHPARQVGGDLYDYFLVGDRLFFCIGDVSGKGVQASLFMASAHYLFRSLAAQMPICDAVRQMNISLCTDNDQCRFVTFWLGCLDLCSGALEYVNAGHDDPVLLRRGALVAFPQSGNTPLGVWDSEEFGMNSVTLEPGDTVLLYTDGVTEAMDADGNEFGRERLRGTVTGTSATDASGLVESVLADVRQHSAGADQSDDITMLCIRFIKNETKQ